ncbi:MAG: DNA polymerase/3'-5' exonuclease PolX, partial [Nitrososphaeraceae archaeon]|nr:DNA polymerase/3'-5' exonuclease PolX [Nitrososphaeraceae archaeon]MDW0333608.1 DNA polymerase/3'-5' exonuclease PolX [Nitrososphaeraceae archaeon]
MISNAAISRVLRQIAYLMELEEGAQDNNVAYKNKSNVVFKIRAYRRTADIIENLSSNVEEIYNKWQLKGLTEIPSVGKAIALKIEELLTTGKIEYFEELKKRTSINVEEFYHLEGTGIGPRTVKALHDSLGIKNLSDLEKSATEGKIHGTPGFSQKKEESILKKIQSLKKGRGRYLLGDIYPLVKQIEMRLSSVNGVREAIAVGSFRRMKETVGDIDYLVLSDAPAIVMDYFASMPEVDEVIGKGPSKTFVKLNNGIDADLLVVSKESFGSALQYFTGSKEHSIVLRKIAISKGLRLNEWGVYDKKNKMVAGSTEEGVYHTLGLDWIPPEMRENNGEIELAKKEKDSSALPNLIQYDSLKGDLQVHSKDTDGMMSIQDIALAAKEKFGLEYIAITDHTKSLALAHGLDERRILDQANKISELNDKLKNHFKYNNKKDGSSVSGSNNFRILSGAEVNIMKDGSLDIPNNILDKLDVVGAAIHSNFAQPIEVQTDRLIKASQNPSVDIIFHPIGRIINKREGYPVNVEKLTNAAKDTGTILEVDAHYNRLDLKDDYIRMAIQNGVKLVIDSDAHHYMHFAFLIFGIGQARRGWAKQSDILNTLP